MRVSGIAKDLRQQDRLAAARILEDVATSVKADVVDSNLVFILAMRCAHVEMQNASIVASLEGINASLAEG